MIINCNENNETAVIAPEGKLDHVTVAELEEKITEYGTRNNSLTLDMAGVEYVSSAALRAILNANDMMEKKGGLKLININQKVMEILRITGFTNYLNIQ